jgi:hypothetical protein
MSMKQAYLCPTHGRFVITFNKGCPKPEMKCKKCEQMSGAVYAGRSFRIEDQFMKGAKQR